MIRKRRFRGNKKLEQQDSFQEEIWLTMLTSINKIIELVEDSKLSKGFYDKAARYINVLVESQGFSKIQSVMVSLIAEATASGNKASLADIADFVDCNGIQIMQYQTEIEELVDKGVLLRTFHDFDDAVTYNLTTEFMEALAKDETFVRKSYAGCTGVSFFQKFYELTHLRHENKMSTKLMKQEFQRLCDDNPNLPFVLALQDLELAPMDKVVITHMCRHLVLHSTENLPVINMSFLYDDKTERENFESSLRSEYNNLLLDELIGHAFSDGFCSNSEYSLTEKSRKLLLKGFNIKLNQNLGSEIIHCKDITQKQLYFGQNVQQQLDSLYGLLNEDNYLSVCARLKAKGLRLGFTCLFYGEPGTGKTESVLQLAQRTGRDLIQLNISEIKSMWVGESEKNIKAVFNRYRAIAQQSTLVPILLFNEADAIIGKRKERAEHSVDKMENTIQNIILQEMESLEGIMIATTNLVENMDSAFERRILYKVKFEKPQLEQRIQIWRSMMPSLSENIISRLASQYDFSGGQIENIVRKCNVESILYGQSAVNEEKIEQYCKEEKIIMKSNHQIGFRL